MAKTRNDDGFNVDFSEMFDSESELPAKKPKIDNDIPVIKEKTYSSPAKSSKNEKSAPYTIYLLSEDDRLFLQLRSQGKNMSMTDFLWKLIEDDIKDISKKDPDINDELHKQFRDVKLPVNTSVKATAKQRDSLNLPGSKHRLKITRYIAYVVHKALINDKDWY